jgi:hypothetical protein
MDLPPPRELASGPTVGSRRRRHANTSEAPSTDSGIGSVGSMPEQPGLDTERFRVCTPPMYPMPLNTGQADTVYYIPSGPFSIDFKLRKQFHGDDSDMKRELFDKVLKHHGFTYDDIEVDLVWRFPDGAELHEKLLTVKITAPWTTNRKRAAPELLWHLSTWQIAAVQCRKLLNTPSILQLLGATRRDSTENLGGPWVISGHVQGSSGTSNAAQAAGDTANREIHVEIMAPEVIETRYLQPVEKYGEEDRVAWGPPIKACLEECGLAKHLRAYTILRIGLHEQARENPICVHLVLDPACPWSPKWEQAEEMILANLSGRNVLDVGVYMEWGSIEESAFELTPPKAGIVEFQNFDGYQKEVGIGCSTSAANNVPLQQSDGTLGSASPTLGTIGGSVELLDKHGNWHNAALTNYHVVRCALPGFRVRANPSGKRALAPPIPGSILEQTDRTGFDPKSLEKLAGKKAKCFTLESPARVKHNHSIEFHRELLCTRARMPLNTSAQNLIREASKPIRKSELFQQFKDAVAFFDEGKQKLGHLAFGSGYRMMGDRRTDWALFHVTSSRPVSNALPTDAEWTGALRKLPHNVKQIINDPEWEYAPAIYPHQLKDMPETPLRANDHACYFAKSARTGLIVGKIHKIKTDVSIGDSKHVIPADVHSKEFCIINPMVPTTSRASQSSDSGSFVWNAEGQLVGIIFAGQKHQKDGPDGTMLSYVTPIHDVWEDIKTISNNFYVKMRVRDC